MSSETSYAACAQAAAEAAAAASSDSSKRVRARVRNIMALKQRTYAESRTGKAEMKLQLLTLGQAGLLPSLRRESGTVVFLSNVSASDLLATLPERPLHFRQMLEAKILEHVLPSTAEVKAKGRAISAVAACLRQGNNTNAYTVGGQRASLGRFAVAGSVGKSVPVRGLFDIDLVFFVNVPESAPAQLRETDLLNPDNTQDSDWMQQPHEQVCQQLLLPKQPHLEVVAAPKPGRAAVTLRVSVTVSVGNSAPESFEFGLDVLLAPNFASGRGALEAATAGFRRSFSTAKEVHRQAVLAPVLHDADAAAAAGADGSRSSVGAVRVQPSYARNIWLSEAATEFMQQAGVAAAQRGGLSGRVVTSTIRLVKAWVRRGLQPKQPEFKKLKSFMIELLVLHAAERSSSSSSSKSKLSCRSSQRVSAGGQELVLLKRSQHRDYVLDLLLVVLQVAVEWADEAVSPGPAKLPPVLFTELAAERYYSRQQAEALLQLAEKGGLGGLCSVKPVVIHPVDPLNNVFDQVEGLRFTQWAKLREHAHTLRGQLQRWSMGDIISKSTLGPALGGSG